MATVSRMFESLGITSDEEVLYRLLLEEPGLPIAQLARRATLSRAQVHSALRTLETKGFVSRTPGKSPRYMPAPPDAAVEILILRRREELEEARRSAARLTETFRQRVQAIQVAELVEVIAGREAVVQRVLQLEQLVRSERLILDRPPYALPYIGANEEIERQVEIMKRGVQCRAIYDPQGLEMPGRLMGIKKLVEAGEEARLLPDVPSKLMVIDRETGLIPNNLESPGLEGAIVVHASSLLDALIQLFEMCWMHAEPLPFATADEPDAKRPLANKPGTDQLVTLLAAGLTNDSIARTLGVSPATVDRRIRELMDALGAKSRFQAGWLARQHP